MSTAAGLEAELVAEIEELAEDLKVNLAEPPKAASAGVVLRAPWTFAIAMNFSLRCASRVLCEILECEVESLDDVYRQVERLNWPGFFSIDKTFSVNSNATDTPIKTPSLTLKIKDALVDSFRRQTRERPSVDKDAPQVRVMARLHRRTLTVSLDTTGVPLAQRGYRVAGGDAPLNELLAAGLVRMTGWNLLCRELRKNESQKIYFSRVDSPDKASATKTPKAGKADDETSAEKRRIPAEIALVPEFFDPMCGTGTFSIEAALQLLNRRPQIERKFFAYMALKTFPESALRQSESIRRLVRSQEISIVDAFDKISRYRRHAMGKNDSASGLAIPIYCSDIDSAAVASARRNAEAAGVGKLIRFERADAKKFEAPAAEGILVMNPPYGVRLGEEEQLKAFYKTLGDNLKKNCRGWQAWILAGSDGLANSVGLRATRRKKVYNGGIECTWLQYVLF